MGRTNLIQTDFIAGELSPRMELQNNLEGRNHGVAFMENFLPNLQGTATTSRGLRWVADIDGLIGRIFGFPVVLLTRFAVVISAGTLSVHDDYGVVRLGNFLANGYFTRAGLNWDEVAEIDPPRVFLAGGVLLSGGLEPTQPSFIHQSTSLTAGTSYTFAVDIVKGGGPVTIWIGTSSGDNDIVDEVIYGEGRTEIEGVIPPGTLGDPVDVWVRVQVEAGDGDVLISGVRLYLPSVGEVTFACPWETASDIEPLQAHMTPEGTSMIFTSTAVAPYQLTLEDDIWDFDVLPLTEAPAEWAAGNFPPAAGFFGGRLWVGGMPSDPSLFWGSKSALYGDFTLGDGTLDDDAIAARLERSGVICWIAGGPGLLIGTSNSEHVISSSDSGAITVSTIQRNVQSTNGSYPTQSLEVGNEVVYISPDKRKIRSIGFEWLKDAWRSRDMTYASEHITEGDDNVTQLCYSANPDSRVIGVTKGGGLITATYETYTQTTGFSRRTTQGTIVSAMSVPFNGNDELWVLVHRGGGVLHVEKEDHPENVKLDSYVRFQSQTPIESGTIPHLAEQTCQVVVDGAVHPDVTLSETGEFTLEYSGYDIYVGLQILSTIITLPVADSIDGVGTTRTMKKRFTDVWVRILNSWAPKINGRRAPNRHAATLMGEVEPARTESIRVAGEGSDMDAQITIEQDLPLRTEIAGWFGRIIQEEI